MEPFKVKELPIEYNIDKELLKLLSEANEKYGEYKSYLKNIEFDSRFFLDSIILSESLKSTQIEGTQISQDEMYYLKYMPNSDDNLEIQNLKRLSQSTHLLFGLVIPCMHFHMSGLPNLIIMMVRLFLMGLKSALSIAFEVVMVLSLVLKEKNIGLIPPLFQSLMEILPMVIF